MSYDDISEYHAKQEAMSLETLKALIKEIYPNEQYLYVITYQLLNSTD
ncbi:ASCH domain-containing protein [Providencia rettgeri]